MTESWQPLNSVTHRDHGFSRQVTLGFASHDESVPIVQAELAIVLSVYPLAFRYNDTSGSYQFHALLGLHPGINLFVNDRGGWLKTYTPSAYRGYPFALRSNEADGQTRTLLYFDHGSDLYRKDPDTGRGEERFFDTDGQLSVPLQGLVKFLAQREQDRLQTQSAIDALAVHKLLIPWELTLDNPLPERPLFSDLYRIDDTRLHNLDGDVLMDLSRFNALSLAYAQLFSLPRIGFLNRLSAIRFPTTALPKTTSSVDALLGKEEPLNFDWDNL